MKTAVICWWRALRRLISLGAVMGVTATAFAILPGNRRDVRSRARWLQRSCARALRVLAIDAHCIGLAPRGQIVTANHLSYIDILVLAAAAPTVFVAKHEVRAWPLFGWFARKAGTRFIDRSRRADVARVAEELAPALAAGVNVVLFLEGTSTDGKNVRPFRSSLLEPAARQGWKIVPAALDYRVAAPHVMANDVCWWGDMTLAPHLWRLAGIKMMTATLAWGRSLEPDFDRKALALTAHTAVVQLRERIFAVPAPLTAASSVLSSTQPA